MTADNTLKLLAAGPTVYKAARDRKSLFKVSDDHFDGLLTMTKELESLNTRFKGLWLCAEIDEVVERYGMVFVMRHAHHYTKQTCCTVRYSLMVANAMVWLASLGIDLRDYKGLARPGFNYLATGIIKRLITKDKGARTVKVH